MVEPASRMTEAAARRLTDRIRAQMSEAGRLLEEAYEQGAWRALGYGSFAAYCTDELEISERSARRVIDQVRVAKALVEATGARAGLPAVSQRQAAVLKDHIDEVVGRVASGEALEELVKEYARPQFQPRAQPEPEPEPAASADALEQLRHLRQVVGTAPCDKCERPVGENEDKVRRDDKVWHLVCYQRLQRRAERQQHRQLLLTDDTVVEHVPEPVAEVTLRAATELELFDEIGRREGMMASLLRSAPLVMLEAEIERRRAQLRVPPVRSEVVPRFKAGR